MEKGIGDMIELFKDKDLQQAEEKNKKKEVLEREASQAEELRLQSLETIGETSKRNNEGERPSKRRRKSDDTLSYLREKNDHERELRQQEIELKKNELEERKRESERFKEMMLHQQQQTTAILQQQQQMNNALLQFFLNNNQKQSKRLASCLKAFYSWVLFSGSD